MGHRPGVLRDAGTPACHSPSTSSMSTSRARQMEAKVSPPTTVSVVGLGDPGSHGSEPAGQEIRGIGSGTVLRQVGETKAFAVKAQASVDPLGTDNAVLAECHDRLGRMLVDEPDLIARDGVIGADHHQMGALGRLD